MKRALPNGLICPKCGSRRWRTVYTRKLPNKSITRRRQCLACGGRITTTEREIGPRSK